MTTGQFFSLTKEDLKKIDELDRFYDNKFMTKTTPAPQIQNYINHVVLVLDKSMSMQGHEANVVKVADAQIKYLARRSQELNQETRVSVYLFGSDVSCLIYDMDVLRLPSLGKFYQATDGSTALIDGALTSIDELEKTAQLHGDHSFLLYYVTDGQNNVNTIKAPKLSQTIKSLPENWTLAVFVPDQNGVREAKQFGFPAQNISVWSTTASNGMEEVGETMTKATDSYMTSRASGVRGTKNLFQMNTNINSSAIKNVLQELPARDYDVLLIRKYDEGKAIKDFVETWTKDSYRVGSAYYQLSKPEKIQGSKEICIQEKRSGKVYTGSNARNILGLPTYEVKVSPADFGSYNIFVQSTSVNRKLVADTQLLVIK